MPSDLVGTMKTCFLTQCDGDDQTMGENNSIYRFPIAVKTNNQQLVHSNQSKFQCKI
jgi:hypothetical protein